MTRRTQISIVGILALLLNSVCFCAAALPSSTSTSSAAHEQHGTSPAHQPHQDPRGDDDCCQSAACSSPTKLGADTASLIGHPLSAPLFVIVRASILDLADMGAKLARHGKAHSPPSAVPFYLAIHALLL